MAALTFSEAQACVAQQMRAYRGTRDVETVGIEQAPSRVLAEDISLDRDYPALPRSVRDGFAVRSADLPGELTIIGEVRAGELYHGTPLDRGEAVEIMTGAPIPAGADAVVMIEHVSRNQNRVRITDTAKAGQAINPAGAEGRAQNVVLTAGARLDESHIGVLATVGAASVRVFAKPTIAILATGDEVVRLEETPAPYQVRNSNAYTVATQVRRAGAEPWILPVAPDRYSETRELIEQGLRGDLLLLSGGVSAGKYDIVERVLADLGAEFYFDRVKIQPGQPLVFGRVRNTFFFGLPGNPVSTMVTFRLFASLAVRVLGGEQEPRLFLPWAPLTCDYRQKPGLTRFLPATLDGDQRLTPLPTQGSSDVFAAARANCYLVTDPSRESWTAGELIQVLLK